MQVGDVYGVQVSVDSRRLATLTAGPDSACTVVRTPPTPVGNEITYATVTAVRTGLCVVQAQETTADYYYTPSPLIEQSFLVGQAQTLSFADDPPAEALAGGTYTPQVTTTTRSGGAPVVLASSTPAVCTVGGGVVSYVGVGTCTLTADQAGTGVYAPATRVTRTFTVHPIPQAVAFVGTASEVYVDDTYVPEVTGGGSTSPVVVLSRSADTCTVAGGVVTFTGIGVCTLEAGQDGDGLHRPAAPVTQEVVVAGLPQVVVPTSEVPTGAVVGDRFVPAATGGDSGQPVLVGVATPGVCAVDDDAVAFTGAGSCVVLLTQAGTSRYATAGATQTVAVGKGSQALEITSAAPVGAVVDETYTPQVTGGPSSASVVVGSASEEVCTVADGVVTFVGRGECEVTANQDGDDNYEAAQTVTQVVAVAGLPQVVVPTSAVPTGAVVGGRYVPTATGGDSGEPVLVGVGTPAVCTATDGVVTFTAAGLCVVLLTQAGTTRYEPAADVSQTVSVSARPQPEPAEPLAACRPGAAVPRGHTLVRGTSRADTLVGTARKELFRGGAGNDRIRGGGGADILCGNAGRDVLDGGAGDDKLSGGPGEDRLLGGAGSDALLGGPGRDALVGGAGVDVLEGRPEQT